MMLGMRFDRVEICDGFYLVDGQKRPYPDPEKPAVDLRGCFVRELITHHEPVLHSPYAALICDERTVICESTNRAAVTERTL